MPPHRPPTGSAADWLTRAKGDLALALAPLPENGFLEDLCYHAQQAGEKAIKAVYIHNGFAFRFVHDIEELLTGLREKGVEIPSRIEGSVVLTAYASEARYPGIAEPVTEQEYHDAVRIAEAVVRWAESMVLGTQT